MSSLQRNGAITNILVFNSGSSSIKYRFFDLPQDRLLASGLLERIGEPQSRLTHRWRNSQGELEENEWLPAVPDHHAALKMIHQALRAAGGLAAYGGLHGIGHRVVHGGELFRDPQRINAEVLRGIHEMIPLAPLHNPANLATIEECLALYPEVPQVAVFDTSFHQTIPPHAFRYAVPEEWYARFHIRRYGFHGTSHRYVARQAAELLGRPLASLNLITLHLGNGSSAAAIRLGQCVDTSMGLTPLEGLVMGTRCGDADPALPFHLSRVAEMSGEAVETLLNTESGLKGLCGANDMREILQRYQSGDPRARLAVEVFCYRLKKYIGAYLAVLGRLDGLVFTGGIGENAPLIRLETCRGLESFGIGVDEAKNQVAVAGPFEIQNDTSPVKVLVIPTNEELEIAWQTVEQIQYADA